MEQRDRGATGLEYVAIVAIAAIVVAATALGVRSNNIEGATSHAICSILTLGFGDCGDSQPVAFDRSPTKPCIVSGTGRNSTLRAGVAVIGEGSERWLIEELGDGRYRLTRATGTGAGGTAGVGFDVTATWNDNDYGLSLSAEANALALDERGEVYYADSEQAAKDLLTRRRWEDGANTLVGDSNWLRGLTDKILPGDDLPTPDETWIARGATGDVSATVDLLAAGAEAQASEKAMLGTRVRKDGTSTTYFQATLDANGSAAYWQDAEDGTNTLHKAQAAGTAGALVEVDYDASGNATAVRLTSTLGGAAAAGTRPIGGEDLNGPSANRYTDRTVELPLTSAQDRQYAAGVAAAIGIPYVPGVSTGIRSAPLQPISTVQDVAGFIDAAQDHGRLWEDGYTLDTNTDAGVNFDARWITGVQVDASTTRSSRTSLSRTYFDGASWQQAAGCTK